MIATDRERVTAALVSDFPETQIEKVCDLLADVRLEVIGAQQATADLIAQQVIAHQTPTGIAEDEAIAETEKAIPIVPEVIAAEIVEVPSLPTPDPAIVKLAARAPLPIAPGKIAPVYVEARAPGRIVGLDLPAGLVATRVFAAQSDAAPEDLAKASIAYKASQHLTAMIRNDGVIPVLAEIAFLVIPEGGGAAIRPEIVQSAPIAARGRLGRTSPQAARKPKPEVIVIDPTFRMGVVIERHHHMALQNAIASGRRLTGGQSAIVLHRIQAALKLAASPQDLDPGRSCVVVGITDPQIRAILRFLSKSEKPADAMRDEILIALASPIAAIVTKGETRAAT